MLRSFNAPAMARSDVAPAARLGAVDERGAPRRPVAARPADIARRRKNASIHASTGATREIPVKKIISLRSKLRERCIKKAKSFLLMVVAAAIISGVAVFFMAPPAPTEDACVEQFLSPPRCPEKKTYFAKLLSWWLAPKAASKSTAAIQLPAIFSQLNVIDGSRHYFSVDEQAALFSGLSESSRDPSSMQVRKLTRTTGNKYGVCGELNSKNGFGGYVGFRPFYGVLVGATARIYLVPQIVVEQYPEEFKKLWTDYGCWY
jgi:hypothetical protein